jgi:PKD repeat protein
LEGFYPDIGVLWSGLNATAENAIINSQTGLINPQLLPPGDYDYLLEYGVGTCYSTDTITVTIDPLPVITIANADAFCSNLLEENLMTPNPTGGYWFGNNIIDGLGGIINTNLPEGDYEVYYTYTQPVTQCSDTMTHTVTIHPVPDATFSADPLGCNNSPYPFTQLTTGATMVDWEFGNGDTDTEWNPTYTYPQIGTYTTTLYASNDWGCTDTSYVEIEVTDVPITSFEMSTNYGCAPLEVTFTNTSYSPFSSFEWTMNGQNIYLETPPTQIFNQGDSIVQYYPQLMASNICGFDIFEDEVTVLPNSQMSFILLNDTVCSPYIAELLYTGVGLPDEIYWNYGNGQTSTGATPIFPAYFAEDDTEIYDITVTGENECGVDSFTVSIWVNPNTIQSFFATNVTSGCPPLEIEVENLSVATTEVTFDFDDGNFSSNDTASNIYYEEGQYTLTQYATNGCSYDTSEVVITVHPAPEFTLIAEAVNFCEGEEASFSIQTIAPGVTYWDFGDGGVASGLNVNYVFDESGDYMIEATILSNLWECVGTESITIEVYPTPFLDIESNVINGCSPLEVSFANQSTDADFWVWDFGDQTPNEVISEPSHIFLNNTYNQQTFTVQLDALTLNGCSSTTNLSIEVMPEPTASFEIDDELLCGLPSYVSVNNTTDGAQAFSWTLNGQDEGGAFEPVFEANQYGQLSIELLATNTYGCTSYATEFIEVFEYPEPQIMMSPSEGCEPLQIVFNDISLGAISSNITIANSDWLIYDGPVPDFPLTIEHSGYFILNMVALSVDGCISQLSTPEIISVWPFPNVDFDAVPLVGSIDNPSISHTSNSTFEFLNLSTGYVSTLWLFGNGAMSEDDSPIIDFFGPGQFQVTLIATSDKGCTSSHSETVIISQELEIYVPNAFTPYSSVANQNPASHGINDTFRAEFSDLDAIESFIIQIYNRWGEKVWESDNPEEYWLGEVSPDGQYFVKDEVYNWIIKIQSNTWVKNARELRGHVTILR